MVHYGKNSQGELEIHLPAEEVTELYELIRSANLLQRRTFYGLKAYIEENYPETLKKVKSEK